MMESNRIKYHFDDFTHKHYDELLKSARSFYTFYPFEEDALKNKSRTVFWRHDVDFSVHEALNLARIEHQNDVRSTFFLLPHSDYYNLFELSIREKIEDIIALGHHIGLHFDPLFYRVKTEDELVKWLTIEKEFLENVFNVKINVFSFHNPTPEMLKFDAWSYAGMINTYANEIKADISYCSDSNGYWRFKRLYDVIAVEKPEKLQVLTHPEWWTEAVMSPKEKVWRCIDKRAEKNKELYRHGIESYGRKIID